MVVCTKPGGQTVSPEKPGEIICQWLAANFRVWAVTEVCHPTLPRRKTPAGGTVTIHPTPRPTHDHL